MNPSPNEYIWIGDLAGYTVHTNPDEHTTQLRHRCGWTTNTLPYLGNLVEATQQPHNCNDHHKPGPTRQRLEALRNTRDQHRYPNTSP